MRTKLEPRNPLIEGKLTYSASLNQLVCEFNAELKGWHYSWESNKHRCDTKHYLRSVLYERRGSVLMKRATCASPPFIIFCRRRKRFTLEPSNGALRDAKLIKLTESETSEDEAAGALLSLMG
jgi:hypothetical protein